MLVDLFNFRADLFYILFRLIAAKKFGNNTEHDYGLLGIVEIQFLKDKYKNMKIPDKVIKSKKIKVSLAILGGGDVVFPIIFTGVAFYTFGLPAVVIPIFAAFSLFLLQVFAKKGKFYPAMPFLTAGCFLGLLVAYLITLI